MRSSSIKTVVAVLSLTITLVAAAPRAEARSSQPTRSRIGATDRLQRAFNSFMKRFGFASEILPTDPIPVSITIPDTETETTTTHSPKKER
jgi:hypothetical protein